MIFENLTKIGASGDTNPSIAQNATPNLMIEYLRGRVFYDCQLKERFHALFLDEDRSYLGEITFFNGSLSRISLRIRDLFSKGLSLGGQKMIIAHNHPSGNCHPSKVDIDATAQISTISNALGIELSDHLIFTSTEVYSIRAGGKL